MVSGWLVLLHIMIDDRFGKNNHPFSAHFCCSMWPWCNPSQTRPSAAKTFQGRLEKTKVTQDWAGLGRPVSARAALVAGSPGMGYILPILPPLPTKWSHVWFIHKISGVRTKYFTFQCPTDPTFHPPQTSGWIIWVCGHQITVNVASAQSSHAFAHWSRRLSLSKSVLSLDRVFGLKISSRISPLLRELELNSLATRLLQNASNKPADPVRIIIVKIVSCLYLLLLFLRKLLLPAHAISRAALIAQHQELYI